MSPNFAEGLPRLSRLHAWLQEPAYAKYTIHLIPDISRMFCRPLHPHGSGTVTHAHAHAHSHSHSESCSLLQKFSALLSALSLMQQGPSQNACCNDVCAGHPDPSQLTAEAVFKIRRRRVKAWLTPTGLKLVARTISCIPCKQRYGIPHKGTPPATPMKD